MRIATLVGLEMLHRKLGFVLALLAIVVGVACSVGVVTLIHGYQLQTVQRVARLDDEIRRITKNMGFNITILPKGENLAEFYASDFAQKTMPYEFVNRLAESPDIVTINHLRPALIRKMEWPERKRQVLLMGVSGVVPFAHRNPKKPLSQPVPAGTMHVGFVLANELGLKDDETVTFVGREFQIGKIYPQRGSKDDITLWIDLATAQDLLDLDGRINMIQALECNCATVDRLAEIQNEIAGLLGGEVQVIELATTAIARAKAREGVKAAGEANIARLERFASMLLPLVALAAAVVVGLILLANVRERRAEIGILRAVGARSGQVFMLFVAKGFVLGLLGAIAGYLLGFVGAVLMEMDRSVAATAAPSIDALYRPGLLISVLLMTPVLTVIASWLPAMWAVRQDPAVTLREE
ncbi:MAG: ABC transporter permease [Pirellulales bacterium]